MNSQIHNVTENKHLADLSIWTLPISLDIDFDTYKKYLSMKNLNYLIKENVLVL